MGDTSVTMFHPPSERTQRASRDAFERVWAAEGWRLVDDEPDGPPAPDGNELDREVLLAEAEALGIKVRANAKTETIAARIAEHRATAGPTGDEDDDGPAGDEDIDDMDEDLDDGIDDR